VDGVCPNDAEMPREDLAAMTAAVPMFLASTEMVYNSLSAPVNEHLNQFSYKVPSNFSQQLKTINTNVGCNGICLQELIRR